MAKQERGLGKGLSALLGGAEGTNDIRRQVQYINDIPMAGKDVKEGEVRLINLNDIETNPFQPRITFDEQALAELSASIKALGLIQPITVRARNDGKYQIISGERRYRASKIAGLPTIPAYIRTTDDNGMLEMAIVENVQREDLDPIETAMSYKRLIDECKLTQEQMADKIGKSRVAVTNILRLLKLPAKVQYDVKVGNISIGHAKVLLGLDDTSLQEQLTDIIITEGLSVRALEDKIKEIASGQRPPRKKPSSSSEECDIPESYYNAVELLGKFVEGNVSVKRSSDGKGSLTMRFSNDKQLEKFIAAIQKAGL